MTQEASDGRNYWLWLHHASQGLQKKIRHCYAHLPEVNVLKSLPPQKLRAMGFDDDEIKYLQTPNLSILSRTNAWLAQSSSHDVLTLSDPRYPALLKEITDPPLVLYTLGDVTILNNLQLGVVGARKATPFAKGLTQDWCKSMSEAGVTITSGLALGIDGEAHTGAVCANKPTIGVLGTSPDVIYPRRHKGLAKQILDCGGVLISELWPTTQAMPENFPRRNRIISGLSRAVLVVEALIRSGSLITARTALDQNRDVFAVPGSLNNPLSKGPHHLIKQGAKLVDNVADILDELCIEAHAKNASQTGQCQNLCTNLSKEEVKILKATEEYMTSVETIVARTGFSAQEVSSRLLELQFQGYIKTMPGGYVRVRRAQNERECA